MKIIITLIAILLLSGCSIDYNINFNENIEETIKINETLTDDPFPAFVDDLGASEPHKKVDGVEYYNVSYNNGNTILNYKFNKDNYTKSNAVNTCLETIKIDDLDSKTHILNTSSFFSCVGYYDSLTNITIRISFDESKYQISTNNADSRENNTLIWYVNKSNYEDKLIQVKYIDIEEEPVLDQEKDYKDSKISIFFRKHPFLIIAVFILLIPLIVYIAHKMKWF